ncbi:MAG: O-antigen ligase family protein [Deltaproteobacteria bacterium]|nr:O-antigen ligase family protein [Deltaproteobacteria bacterium]
MFAIPGIAALVVFILVRPQEYLPLLQRVPFLHLFAVFAIVGYVIDVRLRRTQPISTPALPWAAAFLLWAVVSTAINVPDQLIRKVLEMIILFTLYGTIAHGIQRFRAFQIVVGVLSVVCVFVAAVCMHQGLSPKQCVGGEEMTGENVGRPDGRSCELHEHCKGQGAEPGLQYRCEHVGIADMHSVEGRVRYRGDLQDPNEVALVIAVGGISMLAAFMRRKRELMFRFFAVLAVALCVTTIMLTKSRGGQMAMLLVIFVYLVRAYGWKAFIPAAAMGAPLLLLGGRDDASAEMSTMERYEAWATGLELFKNSPVYGVGAGQFVEYHYLTAHNSFVLAMAELGFVGLVLFVSIIYISMKSLLKGIFVLSKIPGAEVAQVWGMALVGSLVGAMFSISTLSFAYKPVLWIMFALVGAWTGSIRHHQPDFTVKLSWRDIGIIVVVCLAFVGFVLPVFLKFKGAM